MGKKVLAIAVIAAMFSGCGGATKRTVGRSQAPQSGQISKLELRDELDRFESFFVQMMKEAADEIEASATTRRMQRANMELRTRNIEALHAMMGSDDSVVAFLDTWGLIIRLRYYLDTGHGSQLYGEQQHFAVGFIKEAELEIERIGQLFLKTDQFEEVRRNLGVFASQHPITGTYSNLIVYATQEKKEEAGALVRTLSIPMAPIRAMEGVDKTADAILRVRDSVERFTDVTGQIPESTRWQMSMLVDDFEDSEMTQSFLNSLKEFSQSSARLVEVLDSMPAQLKTELLTVLEESDQSQQEFQATMQAATDAAVQFEKTLGEFQKATVAIDEVTRQASETAEAWENASESIQKLVMLFKTKTPRGPEDPPPFGMHDFNNMLTNAGQTADKVSAAAAQLRQTIDSGDGAGIQKELRSLVDHIAKRLFQLILAIFVLAGVYRYVKKKMG